MTREEESRLREEAEAEQPPSGSGARQHQRSTGSVEQHRLIAPSSAARQCQGSPRGQDARNDCLHVSAEAEWNRRALEMAQVSTLLRKGRLTLPFLCCCWRG